MHIRWYMDWLELCLEARPLEGMAFAIIFLAYTFRTPSAPSMPRRHGVLNTELESDVLVLRPFLGGDASPGPLGNLFGLQHGQNAAADVDPLGCC